MTYKYTSHERWSNPEAKFLGRPSLLEIALGHVVKAIPLEPNTIMATDRMGGTREVKKVNAFPILSSFNSSDTDKIEPQIGSNSGTPTVTGNLSEDNARAKVYELFPDDKPTNQDNADLRPAA